MNAVDVRNQMADALVLDLVGPVSGIAAGAHLEREILPGTTMPSRWYLTGFLAPFEANEEEEGDEDCGEQLDLLPQKAGLDDDNLPEATSSRKTPYPSSVGLSVLVPADCEKITVTVTWGDYKPADGDDTASGWKRSPEWEQQEIVLKDAKPKLLRENDGLEIVPHVRSVPPHQGLELLPNGTLAVSIFVVNKRQPQQHVLRDTAYVFQVKMQLKADKPFVPRPDLRGLFSEDPDERVADLQYRDAIEFAVGHGISAHALVNSEGLCRMAETVWLPCSEVERVEAEEFKGVQTAMDGLAALKDAEEARLNLSPMVDLYLDWLEKQQVPAEAKRKEVAEQLVVRGKTFAARIKAGIDALNDPRVFEAFRLANKVMAAAARKRDPRTSSPKWRAFQLAFLLLNINGMADGAHTDRKYVDLLFFPTGGGKTEAYLGLSAFTMILRRLRNPGVAGAGVTVIMRYTLRLLTLDQLGRAAALVCALELERQKDIEKLGTWPFEIGLGRAGGNSK